MATGGMDLRPTDYLLAFLASNPIYKYYMTASREVRCTILRCIIERIDSGNGGAKGLHCSLHVTLGIPLS